MRGQVQLARLQSLPRLSESRNGTLLDCCALFSRSEAAGVELKLRAALLECYRAGRDAINAFESGPDLDRACSATHTIDTKPQIVLGRRHGRARGGGLLIQGGAQHVMLNDCEIDNNFAYGGGAFTGTGVRVELNSCDIHHNDAAVDGAGEYGGAILASFGSLILRDCSLTFNAMACTHCSNDGGGALYHWSGSVAFIRCTLRLEHSWQHNLSAGTGSNIQADGTAVCLFETSVPVDTNLWCKLTHFGIKLGRIPSLQ